MLYWVAPLAAQWWSCPAALKFGKQRVATSATQREGEVLVRTSVSIAPENAKQSSMLKRMPSRNMV